MEVERAHTIGLYYNSNFSHRSVNRDRAINGLTSNDIIIYDIKTVQKKRKTNIKTNNN